MTRKLFQDVGEVPEGRRAIALGTFDGVHLGHRAVVGAAAAAGARLGVDVCAATFHPRPAVVLRPGTDPETLAGVTQRVRLLMEAGAEEVVILRFDAALAALSADRFVEQILVERLGAAAVAVGEDFRFGADREGDVALLRRAGEQHGFAVEAVGIVDAGGERISSSRTRALIGAGDIPTAAAILGRAPSLEGAVVEGDRRGRELGYPTANLAIVPGQCLPPDGVYAGWGVLPPGERRFAAAISIGTNPHFADVSERRIEAHLLGFEDEDLYGMAMRLEFLERLRPQATFTDVEALRAQMGRDVAAVADLTDAHSG
jgi:riboflavin kinase/FMN adenylyltransferase